MADCPAVLVPSAFVRGTLGFVDCQAQQIGAAAYQLLSAPGSTLSLLLTGFLTLFVALFGYRMLFGYTPGIRDGVLALVKIGIVLALATAWPAYRTLVYDVALRGPAELAADIGQPSGLPGAGGGLVGHLEYVNQAMTSLAVLGSGDLNVIAIGSTLQTPDGGVQAVPVVPQPFPGFNTYALGYARIIFLLSALGSLAAVRLVAGFLLALGPFFAAFLLFDATRGLFEGWVRVLAGAALGALGTAIVLGVELALLEPWLGDLIARRSAGEVLPALSTELFVIALMFGLVLLAVLVAAARLCLGFRLPGPWRSLPGRIGAVAETFHSSLSTSTLERGGDGAEARSRAAVVADAVAATQRREANIAAPTAVYLEGRGLGASPAVRATSTSPLASTPGPATTVTATPLGQSFRRTRTRVSATAARRDRR